MGDFDGKVLLITGGGTGLGAAIALGAARRGAKAVFLNCSKSLAEAQAACTGKLGPRPGAPDLPLILSDHTLGAVEARTPDLRVGVTESSGEKALLVEAS